MRTSNDCHKHHISSQTNDTTNDLVNSEEQSKKQIPLSVNIGLTDGQRYESVIKSTNNASNESINPMPIPKPSIGKWMYESDDYLTEMAIDLRKNKFNDNSDKKISNNDDVIFIDAFTPGPSGLNATDNAICDKDINNSLLDCDLDSFLTQEMVSLEDIVIEQGFQPNNDNTIITIDENSDNDSKDCDISGTDPNDIEIIRVKFFSQPIEVDSEIEVLSEILTPQEVIDLLRNSLKSIQQLTQLSFTTIRILMTKYYWNKDLFVNQFFELGIDQILRHYKLVISYELKMNCKRRRVRHKSLQTQTSTESTASSANEDSSQRKDEVKTCLVCFDELNKSEMFGANCGHFLCIDCWNQFITTHVNDSSNDEKMCCPGDKCTNIIDDDDLMAIIQEQTLKDKYQRLITNSYVTNNPLLRWCPNGSCLHAVRVKENCSQDIECICKTVFCFLCGDQWHEPLSCEHYKNWIQKYESHSIDPKSAEWLTSNTKCCPKCQFPIEKNGGCNYIMCAKCRHQFCYYCLGRCSHGRCIGRNAEDALQAQAVDDRLKKDLHIYPFYKDFYKNQSKQLSIEKRLQEGVSQKLERAVKSPEFKSGLKFLKSAFTVLCHCRQTLMYSYVFGYYLVGPLPMIDVYRNLLHELEKQTISLSNVLTKETTVIQKDAVIQIKQKVQPIYRECENRRSALVFQIKQGINHQNWQFLQLN